jgi:tetratricopeptide (TPR) repeat protein
MVAVLSFGMTLPFLWVNCSVPASTERIHDLLRHYGPKEKGGWVSLARYLNNDGQTALHDEVMAEFNAVFPDQRDFQTVQNLVGKGRLDEAEEIIQRLLREQPDNGEYLAVLGFIRFSNKQFGEARKLYNQALRTHPNHYNYLRLGRACAMDGDYEAAARALEEAHRLAPSSEEVMSDLGKAYFYRRQIDKARQVADELLRLNPNSADGHIIYIVCEADAKRFDEATEHYKAFLQCGVTNPQYETIKNRFAWLLDSTTQR